MEIFSVGFIGHREVENFLQIQEQLREIIEKLIEEKEFVEFYVGRNGEFDIIVASVIKNIQRKLGTSKNWLTLVLLYYVADFKYYEEYYNEVIIPYELNNVHYKN